MKRAFLRHLLFAALSLVAVWLLASCGTTPSRHASRQLPAFEPPIAKADFQTVRTTAYTHTESDHLEYGNRNALGGQLHAATAPSGRAEYVPRALPITADADVDYQFGVSTKSVSTDDNDDEDKPAPKAKAVKAKAVKAKPEKKSAKISKHADAKKPKEKSKVAKKEKEKAREEKLVKGAKRAVAVKKKVQPPVIGSAAADWARWPVGTTFRVLSTGQVYRVDDTGWALAGRNTIDLYMANSRDMNTWGTREEKIQVLHWGDPEESARLLASRQDYKHARRMLLEISGRYDEAALLQ